MMIIKTKILREKVTINNAFVVDHNWLCVWLLIGCSTSLSFCFEPRSYQSRFWHPGTANVALVYAGLGLMLGHCFPFWEHFKGGKGVTVAVLVAAVYDTRTAAITLLVALFLLITLQNLTVPPIIFIILFSLYELIKIKEAGLVLLLMTSIMIFKFRSDLRDFFTGNGKKVDVLYTIKKKLGIKRDN